MTPKTTEVDSSNMGLILGVTIPICLISNLFGYFSDYRCDYRHLQVFEQKEGGLGNLQFKLGILRQRELEVCSGKVLRRVR